MFQKMNEYGKNRTPFLFIIDFESFDPIVIPLAEVDTHDILYQIQERKNYTSSLLKTKSPEFRKDPISFLHYKKAIDYVIQNQKEGNSFLANLTFPTPIHTNLSLKEIFYLSKARYKLFYKNQFVVFSPESFVQIRNHQISAYPMKGTIDATLPNARTTILKDPKETAEHATIVDLIRNDLSQFAQRVHVEKYRYIEEVKTADKTLLQVSTKVTGDLPLGFAEKIGDILKVLLPAGSISGAPKQKTVEVLKQAEGYDRGFFTGVFGYFDGEVLDSGVMIRFIEQKEGQYYYKSGGGITAYSDPKKEYQEMIDKVYLPI